MTLSAISLTSGAAAYPVGGDVVAFSFMQPSCATASGSLAAANGTALSLTRNSATTVPATGLTSLNISAAISRGCNDQYLGIVMTVVTQRVAALPPVPTKSCPCWQEPANGVCPGIQLPIRLTTIPNALAPSTAGVSYSQCIDPANYDPETGRMAMSYCWRYECLPVQFAYNEFNATITLDRWNIKHMPAGGIFDTKIRATEGVSVYVTGWSKNASEAALTFGGTPKANDLLDLGPLALPASGMNFTTFTWNVPVGFNDLSASVTMDAAGGPSPPPPAEIPDDPRCRCHDVPNATTGQCADGLILAVFSLKKNESITEPHCIPAPYYDYILNKFSFSMCYQWGCLSNRQFWGQAYVITLPNITQYDVASIPKRTNSLYMDALHPVKVNMSVTINLATNGNSAQGGGSLGPFTTDQGSIEIPPAGVVSLDASISIPAMPWLDGNSVAFEIRAGAAPPPPPNPPPRPPMPPLSPVAPDTTVVIANFVVLDQINSQGELDDILRASSAAVTAKLVAYLVTIPTSFTTFNAITDCSDAAQATFKSQLATGLGNGLTAADITTRCTLPYINVGSRRRLAAAGRSLQQSTSTAACDNSVISVQISLQINASTTATIDDQVSALKKQLFDLYGGDTQVCQLQEAISTIVRVQQLVVGTRRILQTSAATCQAAAATVPRPITGLSCQYTTAGSLNPPGAPTNNDGSSGSTLSGGAVAGIVIGAIAGVAMLALVAGLFVVRSRREHDRKAVHTAVATRFSEVASQMPAEDPDIVARRAVADNMSHASPAYRAPASKQVSTVRRVADDAMVGGSRTPSRAINPMLSQVRRDAAASSSPSKPAVPPAAAVPNLVPAEDDGSYASDEAARLPAKALLADAEVRRSSGSGLAAAAPGSAPATPLRVASGGGRPSTPSRLNQDGEPAATTAAAAAPGSRPDSGKAFPKAWPSGHVPPQPAAGESSAVEAMEAGDEEDEPMSDMVERMLQQNAKPSA